MRIVIIKITKTYYDRIMEYKVDAPTAIIEAIRHGKPLPDNPANGDVIKAMFPTADIATNDKLGEAGTVFVHHKDNITIFHLDWWNTPYGEDGE